MPEHTPKSWYAIAPAAEAPPGRVLSLFGGRVVVGEGRPQTVEFDGRRLPTRVCDGVLFAWFDAAGGPPTFDLVELDMQGWTPSTFDTLECVGQPAGVMRDLADYAHFEAVHGYFQTRPSRPFWRDGAECGLDLDFDWPFVSRRPWPTVRTSFTNRCVGLGYQVSDVLTMRRRMRTRHRVLPTPIDDRRIQVVLGLEVRVDAPLGGLLGRVAHRFTRRMFRRDVADDMTLWARLPQPADDAGDPVLDAYWSWATGFASRSD